MYTPHVNFMMAGYEAAVAAGDKELKRVCQIATRRGEKLTNLRRETDPIKKCAKNIANDQDQALTDLLLKKEH